jgi:hypothetical protein
MKELTNIELLALYEQTKNLDYLKEFKKRQLNEIRDEKLANLIVEVTLGGKTARFNGDEKSQDRLNRAINGLNETDIITWIDADDIPRQLTKDYCRTILRKAGEKQTELFIKCNILKQRVKNCKTEREVNSIVWED